METRINKQFVMVIDDDDATRFMIVKLFMSANLPIIAADNGSDALEFLKRYHDDIACVLLDLAMCGMDGLTVAEQIRINEAAFGTREIPIAFYTAFTQEPNDAVERSAEKYNVSKIFHKPDDTPDLPEKVTAWLEIINTKEFVKSNAI